MYRMYLRNNWLFPVSGGQKSATLQGFGVKTGILLCLFILSINSVFSQLLDQKKTFTRADTLRGSLRPERTCYDVTFYELKVKVDTIHKSISGSSEIFFKALSNINVMQLSVILK